MNKKLLAAAIAASVVAAPAAFAESVVYGKFHTSIDMNDVEFESDSVKDNWSMESRASRLGFKGSEDLGGGLKAIYQAEFSVQTDGNDGGRGQDGGDGWGGQRNTFIGLAGDFGTFLVGRHDTPAKMAFYATGNERLGDSIIDLNLSNSLNTVGLDVTTDGVTTQVSGIDSPGSGLAPIGVISEYRADNAIAYVSPNFSGFTVAAAIIPGEDSGQGSNDRDGLADHYSVGAMYSGNGLKVGAGYTKYDLGADTIRLGSITDTSTTPSTVTPVFVDADDQKQMQIGASYTMNAFSIGAVYEKTDNFGFIEDADYTAWAVTGAATFGNNVISVVYTDGEVDGDGVDWDRGGWGVSAQHNFSKRTTAYVAYADGEDQVKPDNASNVEQDAKVFSLGMIHNF